MTSTDVHANARETGPATRFLQRSGRELRTADLTLPHFSSTEHVEALTGNGRDVRLIVRLSAVTAPGALRRAFENPRISVRYLTDARFHTKLCIVDDHAIVGSVVLTRDGLELTPGFATALLSRDRDKAFDQLPGIFEGLWNDAADLDEESLRAFGEAYGKWGRALDEDAFETYIHRFVGRATLKSVDPGREITDA